MSAESRLRSAEHPSDAVEDEPRAVGLARKLVELARAQGECLERGAWEQFNWLGLRREAVVAELNGLIAAGMRLDARGAELVRQWRLDLARTDDGMKAALKERLAVANRAQQVFGRRRRAISPYLTAGQRHPAFIDRRG